MEGYSGRRKVLVLTLLVEEVVALEAAAEAVEGLAGLPDPEPHRVKRLRHLSGRRRTIAQNGDC